MKRRRGRCLATIVSICVVSLPLFAAAGAAAAATAGQAGSGSGGATSTAAGSSSGYTTVGFTDVDAATPHASSIIELAALGLVDGFPDGSFRPSSPVTRADMAKLIDLSLGLKAAAESGSGGSPYADVAAGQWYTGYVDVATARGIIDGFPDGTFRPQATVSYAQAVTMVVRALGYGADVVGPYPAGDMAEAAAIQNSAGRSTLLGGLDDQLAQPMDRADVARLIDNSLYAIPAATQVQQTTGDTEVATTSPQARTQAARLGFSLDYPGEDQSGPPSSDCYGDIVTGTILTNPALSPDQVQLSSLRAGACGSSPVVDGMANTFTLASKVGLVGATGLIGLTGEQVSFVTDGQGQIVFIGAVTPPDDVLADAQLGSGLTISDVGGVGQLPAGTTQIAIEPAGASGYQSYDVAPGTVAVPSSGSFQGSNGTNDHVTAILNPDGNLIAIIDTDLLTPFKDGRLLAVSGGSGGSEPELKFINSGVWPSFFAVAPGAVVTLDGNPARLSDLKPGMIVNVATNSDAQVTAVEASTTVVSGQITAVTQQTAGNVYLTVGGTAYEVRMDAATYAEDGASIGGVSPSVLSSMDDNSATLSIGADGEVGYINVLSFPNVVGLALNAVVGTPGVAGVAPTLEVEGGDGSVTAYPLQPLPTHVQAGDIVRLTLNSGTGAASVADYSESPAGITTFGSAAAPAKVLGLLGNELRIQTAASALEPSAILDLFVPSGTPVFQGNGGGDYALEDLTQANRAGGIAPAAAAATLAQIQPGDYVAVGALNATGLVEGMLALSGSPGGDVSTTDVDNVVDVAVTQAAVAATGQVGTASVQPFGLEPAVTVSVEANAADTSLGAQAGTNSDIATLTMIGQTLVTGATEPPPELTVTGMADTVDFSGLTSVDDLPAFTTSDGQTYMYAPATVVFDVPDDRVEPLGDLVAGQQVIVYSERLPARSTPVSQFVEIVNTATAGGLATGGAGSVSVSVADTQTSVSCSVYSCEEYVVTGDEPGSAASPSSVVVSVTATSAAGHAYPAFAGNTYVPQGSDVSSLGSSAQAQLQTSTATPAYTAVVFIPRTFGLTAEIDVSAYGGSAPASGSASVQTP